MSEKEFFTASEMTEYIETRFSKKFSRSIISRHLGEMGYSYKNVSHGNSNNETKFLKMRKTYAEIMKPLIERNETFIYIDEMSCCEKEVEGREPRTVSILIACTIYGVLYFHIQEGFINRERFYHILKEFLINLRESPLCKNIQGENEELYLIVDASSIHRDSNINSCGLATMLIEENTDIYYIPPSSPEFNPLEPIFENIRQALAVRIKSNQITDF